MILLLHNKNFATCKLLQFLRYLHQEWSSKVAADFFSVSWLSWRNFFKRSRPPFPYGFQIWPLLARFCLSNALCGTCHLLAHIFTCLAKLFWTFHIFASGIKRLVYVRFWKFLWILLKDSAAKMGEPEKNLIDIKFWCLWPCDRYFFNLTFSDKLLIDSWCNLSNSFSHIFDHDSNFFSVYSLLTEKSKCFAKLRLESNA